MHTIIGHENLDLSENTVATIGTFDGIHLGHREIIEATVSEAKDRGLASLLLTFDIHPRQVIDPGRPVETLTTLGDKLELLNSFDLDYICVLDFKKIANLSAADFCSQILIDKARIAHLFVGKNFRFGAGAGGDPAWLRTCCANEFALTEFPLKTTDGEIISSTKIRSYLKEGKVEEIPQLLGRPIRLTGRVVKGAGRGIGLGFPTANLELEPGICSPAKGVYVGYLWVNDQRLPSVMNCGLNPTFGGEAFHCEAHVLDYHADLYGTEVKLEIARRLRDEMKFPSPEALSRQITDDVHRAREWFAHQENK